MKPQRNLVLLVLLTLMECVPSLCLSCPQAISGQPHGDSADLWVRENYDRALDLVFPERCASPIDARWLACVRIVPAYKDEIEYALSVEKRYDGTIQAEAKRAKARSVYAQLCELKHEHPQASVADLTKLVQMESRTGDQRRFPQLESLADEFEGLRLSPVLSEEIMMDPVKYRFRISSLSGERMQLTLFGPGSTASHQPQPLIQWAESARTLLAQSFR